MGFHERWRERRERWHEHHERWHEHHERWHALHDHPAACEIPAEVRARWYYRWRLQRRIFAWFGLTILLTGLVVAFVFRGNAESYKRDMLRVQTFVSDRFARVWDEPARRDELARSLAGDLDVDLVLRSPSGATLASYGRSCTSPQAKVPVVRGGATLGEVWVCADRHRAGRPWQLIGPLLVTFLILWGASGGIARRLARPFAELERVARAIGQGDTRARFALFGRRGGAEVASLGATMNEMANRIEEQLADQRALLATVSHEIRTPLSRMRLLVELARAGGGDARTLDELDEEIVGVDELVSELLAASRLDFSTLRRTRLLAKEVAETALGQAKVDVSVLDAETPDAAFEGDATLVARAVRNLLENGRRHGGGVAQMRVRTTGRRVVFEVEDDGPGFEAGEEEQVFEPFYSRSKGGEAAGKRSVGLGLALVKRIAEAHGGRAYAENRAGGGARVAVEFPLAS